MGRKSLRSTARWWEIIEALQTLDTDEELAYFDKYGCRIRAKRGENGLIAWAVAPHYSSGGLSSIEFIKKYHLRATAG